jgi:hypothetical protein
VKLKVHHIKMQELKVLKSTCYRMLYLKVAVSEDVQNCADEEFKIFVVWVSQKTPMEVLGEMHVSLIRGNKEINRDAICWNVD